MENKETIKMYELAIFYGEDDEVVETHEYETHEELANELKDLLMYYKKYNKMEIAIITKEKDYDDNIESELLYTIVNERENKEE